MYKILNLPRIFTALVLSVSLAVLLTNQTQDRQAFAPLLIFIWLMVLLALVLLLYALIRKPLILKSTESSVGKHISLRFHGIGVAVSKDGSETLQLPYKAIRGQYWYGDRYFVLFDHQSVHELFCLPVSQETFDDVYLLANTLQNRLKRRLIHFKSKNSNNSFVSKRES